MGMDFCIPRASVMGGRTAAFPQEAFSQPLSLIVQGAVMLGHIEGDPTLAQIPIQNYQTFRSGEVDAADARRPPQRHGSPV